MNLCWLLLRIIVPLFLIYVTACSFDSDEENIKKPVFNDLNVPPSFKMQVLGNVVKSKPKCEAFPKPYIGAMLFPSKYQGSDSSRDTLNKEVEKRYRSLTADIRALETLTSRWSDRYLRGDLAARECAISMLEQWASENALLNESIDNMGQSVRKWALATVAINYLQFTEASSKQEISERSKAIIEAWLVKVAESVRDYYSDRPIRKVNNHDYWAAWAVMSASVAGSRQDLFDWSVSKLYEGIGQIDNNGLLPNELKRETRALSYHNYAMHPLIWLTVFSKVNGVNLSDKQSEALSSLINQTLAGLHAPSKFEKLTGYEQVTDGLISSHNLSWLEVWASTFPVTQEMDRYLIELRPMRSTRSGGNVSVLFNTVRGRTGPLLKTHSFH